VGINGICNRKFTPAQGRAKQSQRRGPEKTKLRFPLGKKSHGITKQKVIPCHFLRSFCRVFTEKKKKSCEKKKSKDQEAFAFVTNR
jgi:hypothetical protein